MKASLLSFLYFGAALAFAVPEPTPYDLIRPVWPQTWDSTIWTKFTPGTKMNALPTHKVPLDYKANDWMPDTVNQAYLDALAIQMSPIRVNQAGYRPQDEKLFYYVGSASAFTVVDLTGKQVGSGTFTPSTASLLNNTIGFWASNNSATVNNGDTRYKVSNAGPTGTILKGILPDGLPTNERLRVKVGNELSATFIVSDRVYSMVRDAALKFFGVNRSGNSESWFHPPSHLKDGLVGGTEGSLSGGWYDCGDHLKESQTQSYALLSLSVMAASFPDRDEDHYAYNQAEINNVDGIPDMLREAKHGADFLIKGYDRANGVIAEIAASVGDFGKDHNWWGRPEFQDLTLTDRGGPLSRTPKSDASSAAGPQLGSTAGGNYAAGLAILSKMYARYDSAFSVKALKIAKELYAYGKVQLSKASSEAYSGQSQLDDEMAMAAIALFYATKDKVYLNDAVEDVSLAKGQTKASFLNSPTRGAGAFNGGWFASRQPSLLKDGANTDWANVYTFVLYAFYKMILQTDAIAADYGISPQQRLIYAEDVALTLATNLGARMGGGTGQIKLPSGSVSWQGSTIGYDPIWFNMTFQSSWIYNRYQAGNFFDVLAYADVTKDLEGMTMPQLGSVQQWNSKAAFDLGVKQMNYLLGVNPWDISMIYGIGDKNYAHPHHRGSNPEGKNVPGAFYPYRPPVGGLFGSVPPDKNLASAQTSWSDYFVSEICLDGSANLLPPVLLLARDEDLNRAPDLNVEIKYVGFDSAIVIVKQTIAGSATINYGTSPTGLTEIATSNTPGVVHTFVLKPLANGTVYYFTATAVNDRSGNPRTRYLVDSTQTPYTFTTLNSPPASADIQNVKVCNVSADSAEIMWYTPNGEYESKIYWDTVLTSYDKMRWQKSGDIAGVPTKFHYMKIGGLQEKTTYYYAVESNGMVKAVDDKGQPLKFTTPVTQYNFEVRMSEYDWGGMSALEMNIYNKEDRAFDSLTIRVYLKATDAQMLNCNFMIRSDICQAYNEAGFNLPCENDAELRTLLRHAAPVKLEDTYDPITGTSAWYFPVPLGSTMIKSASRLRFDIMFSKGIGNPGAGGQIQCDELNASTEKKPSAADGDWSWKVHSKASEDPVDYAGIPKLPKDFGDNDFAPVNPYVTVYRKDEFVWGFSPSYKEQSTKRANYKITTNFEAPFNVSNGTYVQLDQTSSTIHMKGKAWVTEAGQINDIWVNGVRMDDISTAAVYNAAGDYWDLDIPAKLGIGANKVDVTIFAGPDLDCEACQENGGCAFVNKNYFIQFSRPGLTKSSLTIQDVNTLVAVASPAVPGQTIFNVTVSDLDKMKGKPATLDVLVINPRKQDTLVVKLGLVGDVYTTSAPISAVSKDAAQTSGNEIAFFGGDTIYVRYVDPDDEEDISEQSFFAQPTFPMPVAATAKDNNCDGITDAVDILFAQPFGAGDRIDSIWIAVRDPASTTPSDSFAVTYTGAVEGLATITVALPVRTTLPVTGSPAGSVVVRVVPAIGLPEQATVALSDGIPPLFTGATMLENIGHASARDTLKLSFSERVVLPSRSSWPLLVTQGGTLVNTASLVVVGEASTEDDGKSWLYVVEGNNDGLTLAAGYVTQIRDDFAISDLARNPLFPDSLCQEPVTIVEVPKPVPLTFAEMRDRDGDGSADEVYMKFERKLRDKDMLDSFVVGWAKPEVLKSFLPVTPRTWILGVDTSSHPERVINGTDTNIVIVQDTASTLSLTFLDSTLYAYGATQGALNGNGSVTPRLGPAGGFFDRSYTLTDKVGPVVVSARKGSRGADDTLAIVVSEPVDSLNRNLILERRRGGAVTSFAPKSVLMSLTGVYFNFEFNPEANDAIRVGDFVRLVPTGAGVKDKSGNAAGMDNPWVEVRGAISSDVKFKLDVVKNVTGGKAEVIRAGYLEDEPDSKTHFRVTLFYPDSSRERKLQDLNNGTPSEIPDAKFYGVGYAHLGPTFLADLELPGATIVREVNGDTTFVWNYVLDLKLTIFDNLGQFVNAVDYKLDLKELHISTKCAEIMNIQEDMSRSTCQQLVSAGRIDTTQGVDRSFIGADGKMRLRFEWMVHNGAAPKSINGRVVGTGPYIGVFDLTAKSIAQVDDVVAKDPSGNPIGKPKFEKGDVEKTKANKRRTFGLIRAE